MTTVLDRQLDAYAASAAEASAEARPRVETLEELIHVGLGLLDAAELSAARLQAELDTSPVSTSSPINDRLFRYLQRLARLLESIAQLAEAEHARGTALLELDRLNDRRLMLDAALQLTPEHAASTMMTGAGKPLAEVRDGVERRLALRRFHLRL